MDRNIPKVSVLIPAYNAQDFISRTLESVLCQTYGDFEAIVVDDGSTDATAEIVKQIADKDTRVRYYFQENCGLANTRNRLVELAAGEYVAFLDHDDEWFKDKLSLQVDFLNKHSGFGLVFSDALIKKDGKLVGTCFEERKPSSGMVFYRFLLSGNFVPLPTVLMPKEILLECMPFNPAYEFSEEFDVFLKAARRYNFGYLREPLAVYHRHSNNLSDSKLDKFVGEEFSILNYWLKRDSCIEEKYRKAVNRKRAKLYSQQARFYLNNKQFVKAKKEIRASFRCRPFNLEALKLSAKLYLNKHAIAR